MSHNHHKSTLGILRNPRYERFAQFYASGMPMGEAYTAAGFHSKKPEAHGRKLAQRPEVQARVNEILAQSAARSELSRKDILDRILEDWNTARKLGQMASALKAGELIGRETHRMFTERKEVGGPGDFDNKSEEELRQMIQDNLEELGWDHPPSDTIN